MVRLSFQVSAPAALEQVWSYFCDQRRLPEWNPSVRKVDVSEGWEQLVGSVYSVHYFFNGQEEQMLCKIIQQSVGRDQCDLLLEGSSSNIKITERIRCRAQSQGITTLSYTNWMELRGLRKLMTPLLMCPIEDMKEQARVGCLNAVGQKWG